MAKFCFGDCRNVQLMTRDRDYWRRAYETLVAQTGRDLNDGYGIDPRKASPSPLARQALSAREG